MMIGTSLALAMVLQVAVPAPPPPADSEDKSAPARAIDGPGSWVTNDDYPSKARYEKREGTSVFRLTVGTDGLPSDCKLLSSSGHADLDAAACSLVMERARFTPATDRQGKPVVGSYTNRVRWQNPGGVMPNQIVNGTQILKFTLSREGNFTDCEATDVDGSANPAVAATICRGDPMEPFRDASGNAVARRVTITTTAKVETLAGSAELPSVSTKAKE